MEKRSDLLFCIIHAQITKKVYAGRPDFMRDEKLIFFGIDPSMHSRRNYSRRSFYRSFYLCAAL